MTTTRKSFKKPDKKTQPAAAAAAETEQSPPQEKKPLSHYKDLILALAASPPSFRGAASSDDSLDSATAAVETMGIDFYDAENENETSSEEIFHFESTEETPHKRSKVAEKQTDDYYEGIFNDEEIFSLNRQSGGKLADLPKHMDLARWFAGSLKYVAACAKVPGKAQYLKSMPFLFMADAAVNAMDDQTTSVKKTTTPSKQRPQSADAARGKTARINLMARFEDCNEAIDDDICEIEITPSSSPTALKARA